MIMVFEKLEYREMLRVLADCTAELSHRSPWKRPLMSQQLLQVVLVYAEKSTSTAREEPILSSINSGI